MPQFSPDRLHFVSSGTAEADAALARLRARYGDAGEDSAEVVVALGGDGLMLQTLHRAMPRAVPVFGMNCGSVGFLMNDLVEDGLLERLVAAKPTHIYPLTMEVRENPPNRAAAARDRVAAFLHERLEPSA